MPLPFSKILLSYYLYDLEKSFSWPPDPKSYRIQDREKRAFFGQKVSR